MIDKFEELIKERYPNDAPVELNNEEASAWSYGFNMCRSLAITALRQSALEAREEQQEKDAKIVEGYYERGQAGLIAKEIAEAIRILAKKGEEEKQ